MGKWTLSPRSLLAIAFLLWMAAIVVLPFWGSQPIRFSEVAGYFSGQASASGTIFFQIRLPRVLVAVLVGGALSVAGVVFQAVLRNPLATPYTLGISAGAALGAVLAIKNHWSGQWLGLSAVQGSAFVAGTLTVIAVLLLARTAARLSVHTLVLAGVTLNYFLAALVLFVQYLADFTETIQMIRWMMGGIALVSFPTVAATAVVVIGTGGLIFIFARQLDLLSLSTEVAQSRGVPVVKMQWFFLILASLLTGTVVALSGPIGFVGLMIPHLLRLLMGPAHRALVLASLWVGGAFLALADSAARTLFAPLDLPVGLFTALLGGPFFLWLLLRKTSLFT